MARKSRSIAIPSFAKRELALYGGIALVGLGVFWYLKNRGHQFASDVTSGVVSTAGNVVTGAAEGVVLGVGDVLGVPRTDEQKCAEAQANASNWDVAKFCTMGQAWDYWTK